jgi:hypothetical protein
MSSLTVTAGRMGSKSDWSWLGIEFQASAPIATLPRASRIDDDCPQYLWRYPKAQGLFRGALIDPARWTKVDLAT